MRADKDKIHRVLQLPLSSFTQTGVTQSDSVQRHTHSRSRAGPASNLLLAWVSMILYKLCWYSGLGDAVPVLTMFLYYMVAMNLSLAVFNLLPVPPFDGSRIALLFLPQRLYFRAMKYERYIMLAVLALVFLGLLDAPLSWLVNGMWRLMLHLTGFVELLWGY